MYSRTYLHRSCTSSHTSNNFNMVWAMHHTISLQLFLCPRIKLYIVRYIAMLCVYCHNISISNQILIEYIYEVGLNRKDVNDNCFYSPNNIKIGTRSRETYN